MGDAMTLDDFNAAFVYRKDGRDTWRILRGPYEGDCDDYAATVLYITEGGMWGFWRAVLTFRAVFLYVYDRNGNKHLVLKHRKHGFIDNHYPYWRDTMEPHRKRYAAWPPVVAWQMLLGKLFKD